jgi:hypothetical protein
MADKTLNDWLSGDPALIAAAVAQGPHPITNAVAISIVKNPLFLAAVAKALADNGMTLVGLPL